MVYLNPQQQQYLAAECGLTEDQMLRALPYLESHSNLSDIQAKAKAEGLVFTFKQWFMLKTLANLPQTEIELSASPFQRCLAHDKALLASFDQDVLETLKTGLADPMVALDVSEKYYPVILGLLPHFLMEARQELWQQGQVNLKLGKQNLPEISALVADWSKTKTEIQRLHPNLIFKFFACKRKAAIELEFSHPQGPDWLFKSCAQALNWSDQARPGDAWIAAAIQAACTQLVWPLLQRDVLAALYDKMVSAYFEPLRFKLKQILQFSGIGSKPCLLLYPHGRSGVMTMILNQNAEVKDTWVFYPHAPDYDGEATLADLAKAIIKHGISDIGLVLKPETKKILVKKLGRFSERYPDLSWQLHGIPGEYAKLFPMQDTKQPCEADVLWFGRWLQDPRQLWQNLNLSAYLGDLAAVLPTKLWQDLWSELCHESKRAAAGVFGFPKLDLAEIKPSTLFLATLTSVTSYGLFLELAPGVEGLLHVSAMGGLSPQELAHAFKPGEHLVVEWLQYDAQNKRISFKLPQARMKAHPTVKKPEQSKPKMAVKPALKKPVVKAERNLAKPALPGAMQMAFAKLKEQS